MAKQQLYLTAYDISDASRLQQVLYEIKQYATGGQKSAYECYLSESEKQALYQRIHNIMDTEEDRFMLLRLDPRMRVQTFGIAVKPANPDYFFIG